MPPTPETPAAVKPQASPVSLALNSAPSSPGPGPGPGPVQRLRWAIYGAALLLALAVVCLCAHTLNGHATQRDHQQRLQRAFLAEIKAAPSAQERLATLQTAQQDQLQQLQDELKYGTLALLALLAVCAVGVAEPTARWLGRRAQLQQEKSLELQRLALVAEHTNALVLITDANDHIVWANGAFADVTGWPLAAALGHNPQALLQHPRADEAVGLQLRQAISAGHGARLEGLHQDRSGHDLWLDIDLRALHDGLGRLTGFVRVASNVTERRLLQDQVHVHARTDSLTALPNRAVVMERLAHAIAHAQRHPAAGFAVLFMDFDRFKQVNDTLGHSVGDELLRQIAQRLTQVLRHGDLVGRLNGPPHLAARLGGDEFVVVLDRVDSKDMVALVAQRLLTELAQPYQLGHAPVHSSVSIGVVLIEGRQATGAAASPGLAGAPEKPEQPASWTAQDVLRDADTAMYEAKRAGRGRWVLFDASMREKVLHSLALEQDLREALVQEQLSVVYQPVMDLATRRLTGVEALVRWRHPTRGMVPPLEFIPVAEESGLIDEVGAVVLRQACTQFVGWRRSLGGSAPRQLAVNLSRAQLKRVALVSDVRNLLRETGMQPEWLQLEVTESLAAQDERVQLTLRELKDLGVKLALDDFGTGYSSLACLHLMPVDTVKIDRSFVQHAQTVEYHRVLIEATIRVARTLGMTTVAEGIETESQAALMLQLDCDRGQGYLYSKPVAGAAIEAFVRAELEACV